MAKKVGTNRVGNSRVSECVEQAVPAKLVGATFGWGEEGKYLVDFGKSVGQEGYDVM